MRKKTSDKIQTALTEGGTLSHRLSKKGARRGGLGADGKVVEKTRKGTRVIKDFGKGGR